MQAGSLTGMSGRDKSEPHPNAAPDQFSFFLEDDTCRFEGQPQQSEVAFAHVPAFFEGANGNGADSRSAGKLILSPVQKSSSGAALLIRTC